MGRLLPEHPDLACADAAALIPARTLWELLRTHRPMLLGAAVQTANGALSPGGADQAVRRVAGVLGARRGGASRRS